MSAPVETLVPTLPLVTWQPAFVEEVLDTESGKWLAMPVDSRWNPLLGKYEATICRTLLFSEPGLGLAETLALPVDFLHRRFSFWRRQP